MTTTIRRPPRPRGNPVPADLSGWLGLVADLAIDLRTVLATLEKIDPSTTASHHQAAAEIADRMRSIMNVLIKTPTPRLPDGYSHAAQVSDLRAIVAFAGSASSILWSRARQRKRGWEKGVRWRIEDAAECVAKLAAVHAPNATPSPGSFGVPAKPSPDWYDVLHAGDREW